MSNSGVLLRGPPPEAERGRGPATYPGGVSQPIPAMDAAPVALPDDNTLVIGEGVVLDLHPASFATRLAGALFDYILMMLILIAGLVAFAALFDALDFAAASALYLVVNLAVVIGVPILVETLTRGKSLGRLVMGTRVVRDDGGAIRLRHAVIRALVGVLEIWGLFAAPAVICSLANAKGKRVGDLLAGTYVVRERGYKPPELHLSMPPHLGAWAAGADIARLPDDLAMAIRQFLTRAQLLNPAARAGLGRELADDVRARVAPAPPAGTHPEDFLAAVMVARRDRELARLIREREAAARREQALHKLPHHWR